MGVDLELVAEERTPGTGRSAPEIRIRLFGGTLARKIGDDERRRPNPIWNLNINRECGCMISFFFVPLPALALSIVHTSMARFWLGTALVGSTTLWQAPSS